MIQNTTYIGKYAFKGCSALDQFILNNALQTIDEGAFQGCKGIEYMTIPRETTTINPNGWIGCNDNFFFYVYEPEENWSKGWVTNWNCDYPVYVLGSVKDDVYTYVYDTTEKKFYITGLTPNATLNGVITIPHIHNGIQVVGIDESRRTEEDIAAGAKDIRTQQGITKVILPKVITKIVGSPFQTGFRVDIYTELTKDEVSKVYNDSYAALEKEFTEWKRIILMLVKPKLKILELTFSVRLKAGFLLQRIEMVFVLLQMVKMFGIKDIGPLVASYIIRTTGNMVQV